MLKPDEQLFLDLYREHRHSSSTELPFNVFRIMDIEHDETRLHSKLLSHFIRIDLKGFLKAINAEDCFSDLSPSSNDHANLIIENEVMTFSGQRMDIVLETENGMVVIENKIYATDQPGQLYNYYRHAKLRKNNFRIFYLNLDGAEPKQISILCPDEKPVESILKLESGIHFFPITYQNHIRSWITSMLDSYGQENSEKQIIRQYLMTLDKLCLSMNDSDKNRLGTVADHLPLAKNLWIDIKKIEELYNDFWRHFSEEIKKSNFLSRFQWDVHYRDRDNSIMINVFENPRAVMNLYIEPHGFWDYSDTFKVTFWANTPNKQILSSAFPELNIREDGYFLGHDIKLGIPDLKSMILLDATDRRSLINRMLDRLEEYLQLNADLLERLIDLRFGKSRGQTP